eukprot:TRINITY_DN2115_c0_g1_i8.p1 TRINITY_DN2115_c0_g1~~TRINITY_DN2115_c0_g1_i8.p1  ORF type:complete len:470 (+),score=19.90 TRINITY_DN2115_c0_g1_i8:2-1411(+)
MVVLGGILIGVFYQYLHRAVVLKGKGVKNLMIAYPAITIYCKVLNMLFTARLVITALWLLLIQAGQNIGAHGSRQLMQSGTCADMPPPNAPFSCQQYLEISLCDQIEPQYCELSCGRCPGQGSEDRSPTVELLSTPGDCSAAENLQCDVDALLGFKDSLTDGSFLLSSWSGSNPCDWTYIVCNDIDGKNQRVSELQLDFYDTRDANKLFGQIISDFSKMRYLKILQINTQNLRGQLPKEFSVLDKLEELRIFRTQISGSLPVEYSTMTNIKYFATSFNNLKGPLPPEYSTFKKLEYFYQAENQLSNTLPIVYSTWKKLLIFDVPENQLSGSLPKTLSTWTKCNEFDIQQSQISGTLPREYSNMLRMEFFIFYENSITDTLPPEYSNMLRMQTFSFYDNLITGTLPEEYSRFSQIDIFAVQENKLVGTLPPQYSVFEDATYFRVWDNKFSGTLPPEYSNMKNYMFHTMTI